MASFKKLLFLASLAGAAVAGVSYILKYKGYQRELEGEFKEFDDELDFKIVGSTEANSLAGKISNESPLGKALLGKKIGETAVVETQAGVSEYMVLGIQRVS